MKKENIIIISLYAISIFLIIGVAYPIYSGGGLKVLPNTSNIMYELARYDSLKDLELEALKLKDNGIIQAENYINISQDKKSRIDVSIPEKIDIGRKINDLAKIAQAHKMKMSDIKFSKNTVNKKFPDLNTYDMSMSLEGEYLNFRDYINTVQNSLQIYNIKSLSFSRSDSQDQVSNYKFSLTVEAFELK